MQDKQERQASLFVLQDLKLFTARASKVKVGQFIRLWGQSVWSRWGPFRSGCEKSTSRWASKETWTILFEKTKKEKQIGPTSSSFSSSLPPNLTFHLLWTEKKLFERDREEEDLIKRLPIEIESREGDTMISCRDDQLSRDKRSKLLFTSSRTNFSHQGWLNFNENKIARIKKNLY